MSLDAPCGATLLSIYIGDDDTFEDKPLADQIILKARALGLAGATVTRGTLAFGPASRERRVELRLSEDRPIVISIVDTDARINAFLPAIEHMVDSGLITIQAVTVLRYGRKAASG
jgi:uncharacterized protein